MADATPLWETTVGARPPADADVHNVPRERLAQMATAIRKALPQCRVDAF